jgi:hypothetical protein
MSIRIARVLLIAAFLLISTAQAVGAATAVHLEAHFVQHFGGLMGDGPDCPPDVLNCGSGRIEGYGPATDVFWDDGEHFLYTISLADGSSITAALEFASDAVPGASNDAPGAGMSFGNPAYLTFDAEVLSGTGAFTGASGTGTAVLHLAGNVDQISLSLDLVLP